MRVRQDESGSRRRPRSRASRCSSASPARASRPSRNSCPGTASARLSSRRTPSRRRRSKNGSLLRADFKSGQIPAGRAGARAGRFDRRDGSGRYRPDQQVHRGRQGGEQRLRSRRGSPQGQHIERDDIRGCAGSVDHAHRSPTARRRRSSVTFSSESTCSGDPIVDAGWCTVRILVDGPGGVAGPRQPVRVRQLGQ